MYLSMVVIAAQLLSAGRLNVTIDPTPLVRMKRRKQEAGDDRSVRIYVGCCFLRLPFRNYVVCMYQYLIITEYTTAFSWRKAQSMTERSISYCRSLHVCAPVKIAEDVQRAGLGNILRSGFETNCLYSVVTSALGVETATKLRPNPVASTGRRCHDKFGLYEAQSWDKERE